MFPCTSGAYCPPAQAINTSVLAKQCYPYERVPHHGVGCPGARENLRCPEGGYCPNSTVFHQCNDTFYCRLGAIEQSTAIFLRPARREPSLQTSKSQLLCASS